MPTILARVRGLISPIYADEPMRLGDSASGGVGIATTSTAGLVRPDGTTITVDGSGIISAAGGGGGGGTGGYSVLDLAPGSPTPYDDEFQYGTAFDTSGARRSGANAWDLWSPSGSPAPSIYGADFLKIDGTGGSHQVFVAAQPVPVSGAWEFTAKCLGPSGPGYYGPCLGVLNRSASTDNVENIFVYSGALYEQSESLDATTNVLSYVNNNVSASFAASPWYYLRVSYPGSGTNYDFSYAQFLAVLPLPVSMPSFSAFTLLHTQSLAGVTHIALSTVESGVISYVDWFRRTA